MPTSTTKWFMNAQMHCSALFSVVLHVGTVWSRRPSEARMLLVPAAEASSELGARNARCNRRLERTGPR